VPPVPLGKAHVPFMQDFPLVHGALQAPQWVLLVLVSTQALPHNIWSATAQPQTPLLQVDAPDGQALQPPQWRIVPSPPCGTQAFPVHVTWPAGHSHMQTPFPHTVPLGQPAPHGQPIVPPPPPVPLVPAADPPLPPGAPAMDPPPAPAAPASISSLPPRPAPPPPDPAAPAAPPAPASPPSGASIASGSTSPQPAAATTTTSTISLIVVFMRFAP